MQATTSRESENTTMAAEPKPIQKQPTFSAFEAMNAPKLKRASSDQSNLKNYFVCLIPRRASPPVT